MANPLQQIPKHGQSIWLDSIRRDYLEPGPDGFAGMIERDDLRGVTSNPAIFEQAIAGNPAYQAEIHALVVEGTTDNKAIYEHLAVADIRAACDVFGEVYARTDRLDGYVSLEVSPTLANDTEGTLAEARRLWAWVDRPNLMVKVPATVAGIPAIEALLGEGINVNVTLLFARAMYRDVAEAFQRGAAAWAEGGGEPGRLASVASFFVSRIDGAVDKLIAARKEATPGNAERAAALDALTGKVAIANAKLAFQDYKRLFGRPQWEALAARGMRPQRLLWASTSVKSADLPATYYVEALIGDPTVNTIPPATYDAMRARGEVVADAVGQGADVAEALLGSLDGLGISLEEVTDGLLREGVEKFTEPFAKLLDAIEMVKTDAPVDVADVSEDARDAVRLVAKAPETQRLSLPASIAPAVRSALSKWDADRCSARLWQRDATLWTDSGEADWLGWLDRVDTERARLPLYRELSDDAATFSDVVLLGMGGSSLAAEVIANTYGPQEGHPRLHVLDSTDPQQLRTVASRVGMARTLVVVASKSGTTLEPSVLLDAFLERLEAAVGPEDLPRYVVAITDPDSALARRATAEKKFRHVVFGEPTVGGRYAALSPFGLAPAAMAGVDISKMLDRAAEMVAATAADVPVKRNPAVVLGLMIAVAAQAGRDKLTIAGSERFHHLGAWLEQLVAESLGKRGVAVIPVDGESLGAPPVYAADRIFLYLRDAAEPDSQQDRWVETLAQLAHPTIQIDIRDPHDLGREFFRFQFATAVAGSVLGVNPFDQPDVEAAKITARRVTDEIEKTGRRPDQEPLATDGTVSLYTDAANTAALRERLDPDLAEPDVAHWLAAHLARIEEGDYLALLAFVEMSEENEEPLQRARTAIRDHAHVATCLGFGPRFLHSTGQAHKGGPNTGVFLQITGDDAADVEIPGRSITFGAIKAAQAQGDFEVLAERGRRILRVHIEGPVEAGLHHLEELVLVALNA